MKDEKDDHLDEIFQKGLRDPVEPVYREQDWNVLERMLDRSKKSGGAVFWLRVLSSAALILIVAGWWILRPRSINTLVQKRQPEMAAHQLKPIDKARNALIRHHNGPKNISVAVPSPGLATVQVGRRGIKAASGHVVITKRPDPYPGSATPSAGAYRNGGENFALTASSLGANDRKWDESPVSRTDDVLPAHLTAATPDYAASKPKIAAKTGLKANPRYALNVLGAPELNGVNSLQQTRSGTNVGVLFSVGLFNKLTVSTGAQYSNKPYNSYFTNVFVKNFNSDLTSINANCRLLDIPLNLDYQLFGSYRNKFSIGTGFSSYIMLHESYVYNYSNPAVVGPINYTVPYSNKYLFDILNLQATYTRQVNSKVGLTLTPYIKLPFTGIGANQARLQTTGVALGLTWNLNSPYKL